jgi:hypothetical protein
MIDPSERRIGNIAQLSEVLTKPPGIFELLFMLLLSDRDLVAL